MYDDLLLPTDGSDGVEVARERAFDVAERYDATVHALYVADSDRYSTVTFETGVVDVLERVGIEAVAEVAAHGKDRGLAVVEAVVQGAPHKGIIAYAEEHGIDLIVMATHGRTGVDRYLLGSVTERVLRTSPVPVLAVPLGAETSETDG